MATALNLFPARIAFVNPDGTLTAEAYRALQSLMVRVGGPLGDNGSDVFASLASTSSGTGSAESAVTDMVGQSPSLEAPVLVDVPQAPQDAPLFEMVLQPTNPAPGIASGGAAPAGGIGTVLGAWDTAANRDASILLLNTIRRALIAAGIMT